MKKSLLLSLSFAAAMLLAATSISRADDKKVTVTGEGQCAKCSLKKADSCQNAVVVEKDGKKTTYLLEANDVSKKFHKNICSETKKIKVTGTHKEVDGKHILVASQIDVVEK